jgi:hypothetical protein
MMPLQELLRAMIYEVPEDRPTARQALDDFTVIEQVCRDLASDQLCDGTFLYLRSNIYIDTCFQLLVFNGHIT